MAQAVRWDLIADSRRFQRGFAEAERTTSRFSAGFKRTTSLIGGALAGIAVAEVFKGFLDEGREAQKVGRQTAAVIKSTGGAAHLSAKGFSDLAGRLSDYAAIDDEVIQGGENILATFTRIKAGGPDRVFERASKAALDMAASMGHGEVTADNLQAANLRLGKALNDPLKGMSALTRVGVTFSKQQKEQIEGFVKAGDTAKAQGVILDEVAKEFGGSAGAAATGWDRFKVALGNFQEFVGTALLPVMDKAGVFLADLTPKLETFASSVAKKFGPALGGLTEQVQKKFDTFKLDTKVFLENLVAKMKGIAEAVIGAFQVGLKTGDWSQLGGILGNVLKQAIGNGVDLMAKAFSAVDWVDIGKYVGSHAFGFAVGFISALGSDLLETARKHPIDLGVALVSILGVGKIGGVLARVVEHIPILRIFAPLLDKLHVLTEPFNNAIGRLVKIFGEGFAEGLGKVFPRVGKVLDAGIQSTIFKRIGDAIAWIQLRAEVIAKAGRNLIKGLAGGIGEQVGLVVKNIGHVIRALVSPFTNAGKWLVGRGRQVVQGLGEGIVAKFGDLAAWLVRLKNRLTGFFDHARDWLYQKGRNVIAGFWDGLLSKWKDVQDWFLRIPKWIKEHKGPLSLDRRLLVPAGAAIMGGFAKGLRSGAQDAMNFVKGIVGDIWAMLASGFSGGNVAIKGGPIVDLARNMAAQMGWTGKQWAALYQLVAHESSWNPQAQNSNSTAYGLFQFLDSTWASTGFSKSSNPAIQIAAGLNYIRQRYGNPASAWSFWQGHHWYAKGVEGVFNKPTLIGVGEAGPEAVSVQPLNRGRRGKGGLTVNFYGPVIGGRRGATELADMIHTELLNKKRGQANIPLGLS